MDTITDPTSVVALSREARLYAIKELARRAGVTAEFFRSWRFEVGSEETSVFPQPGTNLCIRFRNAPAHFWGRLALGAFYTLRASWMLPPPERVKSLVPDFVIPFSHTMTIGNRPLFFPASPESVECAFDLPLSTLLTLSRFEETLPAERDCHDRFPAAKSVAHRGGYLNRPVVDEYGLAFEQALTYLLPTWRPAARKLRVKLSHDVDEIGLPFSFRNAMGHTFRRGKPVATLWDLLGPVAGLKPTYLHLVEEVVRMSLERGLDSAVYWKSSASSRYDTGYDPRHPQVREVISWLHKQGVETGVHPSYYTFCSPDLLQSEVAGLREVLGDRPLGGRQDFLRWGPETWVDWETCGLAYDSSVGFADRLGFRAGTCIPYRPWLLSSNREANLLEIPLLVMDSTLVHYMHLTSRQSIDEVLRCAAHCRAVGGVFTLLWHNTTLLDPPYYGLYEAILDALADSDKYDWTAHAKNAY